MDNGFLTQLKKPSTLLGDYNTICGSCFSLKTPQISAQVTLGLFVVNRAVFLSCQKVHFVEGGLWGC